MTQAHVLLVGTDRLDDELPDQTRKKYRAFAELAPHAVISYSTGRRFQRRRDEVDLYLIPSALPTLLRIPVFWVYTLVVATWLVLRGRATVLVSQSPYDGVALVAVRGLASLVGRKVAVVIQIQGDWEDVLPLVHRSAGRLARLWRPILRSAVRRADLVRTVTALEAERIGTTFAREVVTFPTWTDFDLFMRPVQDPPAGDPMVLFAGVLTPVKGVDVLVEAIGLLADEGRSLRLVVAGEGPEREALAAAAAARGLEATIEWRGHVTQRELGALMDDCSVFVLPSRTEGLPRVVLEAMARARPVVASNVGGLPELVTDRESGRLVPPDDAAALALGIAELLEPDVGSACGSRGRRTVEDRFGREAYLSAYSDMLFRATSKCQRRA